MFVCIFLWFVYVPMCPLGPTQYIFHTFMSRYSLYVLKVSLNTNKQLCVCLSASLSVGRITQNKLVDSTILLCAVTHAPFHASVLRPTSWPNARK